MDINPLLTIALLVPVFLVSGLVQIILILKEHQVRLAPKSNIRESNKACGELRKSTSKRRSL